MAEYHCITLRELCEGHTKSGLFNGRHSNAGKWGYGNEAPLEWRWTLIKSCGGRDRNFAKGGHGNSQ